MHEGDLEAEHPAPRLGVDQLGTLLGQVDERRPDVCDRVGDVMHPGPALREEAPDGRVLAESREQLDAAVADAHRRRLDALLLDPFPVLEPPSEQALVGGHRLVEVGDGKPDVMNAPCFHPDDVTVAHIARRLPIGLLALVAVLAGCGGSKSNGEAEKPAAQVVADAKAAALAAKSVHVAGSITDAGQPLTLDLDLARDKGGKGTMSESGLAFEIIRVGDRAYIRGSDAFLKKFAGAAGAQLLHGKWLQGSATSGDLSALAPLTDIGKLMNGALGGHGKLRNAGETQYKGQKVVAIEDRTKNGTLYVAATGTPYPVAIVGDKSQAGTVTFDNWNESVSIVAPKGAIDMSKLGTG